MLLIELLCSIKQGKALSSGIYNYHTVTSYIQVGYLHLIFINIFIYFKFTLHTSKTRADNEYHPCADKAQHRGHQTDGQTLSKAGVSMP